jgi:ABC-type transport system substrate-binding protein
MNLGKKKLWNLLVVIVCSLAVVLSGCTSGNGGPSSNAGSQSEESGNANAGTGSVGTGLPDAGDGGPKRGGTLRVAIPNDANTLGYAPDMRFTYDFFVAGPALETLGQFDDKAVMQPFLAESWESDPDNLRITIKLRPNVKFHDGTDFDAAAAKWNIDLFIEAKRSELSGLASVEVVDPLTLQLNLSEWNSSLLDALCTFVYMISPTAFEQNGKDWAVRNPVGTGPFVFESWDKDVGAKFTRFDQYWQEGKPYLDAIEFVVINDQMSAMAAFQNKEVDIYALTSPQVVNDLQHVGEVILLRTGNGVSGTGLTFNSKDPNSPFHDVRVRQAVAHAIDVKSILDALFHGFVIQTNQWGVPGIWAHNADVGFTYDPEKAKQLLAEVGYPNGFSTKLTIRTTEFSDLFTAVQSYLEAVGIKVEIEVVDLAKFNEMVGTQGTWDGMIQYNYRGDSDLSTYMPRNFGTNGVLYAKQFAIPDYFDQMFAELKAARDHETRTRLAKELQYEVYQQHVLAIPMFVGMSPAVKHSHVKDEGINIGYGSVWEPQNAWLDQ